MNKRTRVTAVLCGIVLLLAAVAGYRWYQSGQKRDYQLAGDAIDGGYVMPGYTPEGEPINKAPSYFAIQINASPVVKSSGRRCNLMVGNPTENEDDVRVKLILDETGEVLFYSDILKPGERSVYVSLENIPEPGEHPATAVFEVYKADSSVQTSEIDAGVLLTVER